MKKSFFLVDCDGANRQDSSSGQGSIRKLNIVTAEWRSPFPRTAPGLGLLKLLAQYVTFALRGRIALSRSW